MAKHLGRNPFSKSKNEQTEKLSDEPVTSTEKARAKKGYSKKGAAFLDHPAKWLLVDLPADSITFALKTALLVKSVVRKEN